MLVMGEKKMIKCANKDECVDRVYWQDWMC